MAATIAKICRYPVKGLSAQELQTTMLAPGEGLPQDRRFAILLGAAALDDQSAWRSKSHFLTLMRHERLAALSTDYDEASETLTIRRSGRQVARGILSTPTGRSLLEQFFAAYMAGEVPGVPKIVEAPGVMFSDCPDQYVSVVNLASVRDIERIVHQPVHPLRFRANLYLEGLPAWEESSLVGRSLAVGAARLDIVETIDRCAATSVDPASGMRDINIPRALQKGFGHCACGVYARVAAGGAIAVGDAVAVV